MSTPPAERMSSKHKVKEGTSIAGARVFYPWPEILYSSDSHIANWSQYPETVGVAAQAARCASAGTVVSSVGREQCTRKLLL